MAAALGDSGDDGRGGVHVELPGGVVIQEHQRLGALSQQIVDAHAHEIDAHRVVDAGLDRHLELGADPVGRRDQQRVIVSGRLQVEERPETAQRGLRAGPAGGLGQGFDAFDQRIPGVDIDASLGIGEAVGPLGHDTLSIEICGFGNAGLQTRRLAGL